MFKKKRNEIKFNNYMEQSAFTAGLAYSQMLERIDQLDSEITSEIILNKDFKPFSVLDIDIDKKEP